MKAVTWSRGKRKRMTWIGLGEVQKERDWQMTGEGERQTEGRGAEGRGDALWKYDDKEIGNNSQKLRIRF